MGALAAWNTLIGRTRQAVITLELSAARYSIHRTVPVVRASDAFGDINLDISHLQRVLDVLHSVRSGILSFDIWG